MQRKTAKKILKITLIVVASVILLLLGIKAGERIVYASFYANAEKEFGIPGLNDNFVPQGMDYIPNEEDPEKKGIFLLTGYMSDGSASRVYALDYETRKVLTWAELKQADGSDHTGHTGGIARNGDYVYVTDGEGLDVFLLEDLLSGSGVMTKQGTVKTYCDPAYCYVYQNYVIAGSFYRAGPYETPKEHHLKTPWGDENTAMAFVFELDGEQPFGVDPTPVAAISTPSQVQGICVTGEGDVIISTSWGFNHSYLHVYDGDVILRAEKDFAVTEGCDVPLFYLDGASLSDTITAPPMSEEIIELDGRLYIFNESACNKYIFGKLFSAYDLYSYGLK